VTKNEIGLYEDGGKIKIQGEGLHFSRPLLQVYYIRRSLDLSCEGGRTTNILGEDIRKPEVCKVLNLDMAKFISRAKSLRSFKFANDQGEYNFSSLHRDAPELFEVVTTTN
jgi:hypothetical protein